MNLGLALIIAMLWQGTFAQPQLAPTRPPNSVTNNGTNSQHVADSPTVNLDKNSDKLDGRYGVDRIAMEKAAQQAADATNGKAKPSPQITVERAVLLPSEEPPNGPRCMMYPCGHKMTLWCHHEDNDSGFSSEETCSDKPPLEWTCRDKSATYLESLNGREHWCLKITQGGQP